MRKDYNLEKRKYVIGGFIVVLVCIYVVRLFMLQIMDQYQTNQELLDNMNKVSPKDAKSYDY